MISMCQIVQISKCDDVFLLANYSWPNLRTLNLSTAGLRCVSIDLLCHASLPRLQHLNLGQNQLDVQSMQYLVQGNWPKLQQLDLRECAPCARDLGDYGTSQWLMIDGLFSGLAAGKWPELAALDVRATISVQMACQT